MIYLSCLILVFLKIVNHQGVLCVESITAALSLITIQQEN